MSIEIRQESAQDGKILMARDAFLLQQAAEHHAGPILRFYQWIRPTISLGFHQRESVLDEDSLARERIPWVRRPTGGAAVLHSEELTYCLVLPVEHCFQKDKSALRHTGNALARGLQALGVSAEVVERGYPLENLPNRTSCFVRSSRWEVCVRGKKIVGSAQRFLNGALLQHGSILCGPDHLRLTSLLRLPSDEVRHELHSRLRAASTSIREELSAPFNMTLLRQHLAQAFRQEFSVASPEPMRSIARIPEAKEIA